MCVVFVFVFKQNTAYELRISDWSSDVCSSDLILLGARDMFLEGLQADLTTQPVDPACPKLGQYLMASMGSLPDEVLRILFLDASYRLIADEQLHHGSVRQLELYPRTIFRRSEKHTSELQSLMRLSYAVFCFK